MFNEIITVVKEVLTLNQRVKKLEEAMLKPVCPSCHKDTLSHKTETCCEIELGVGYEHVENIVACCPCGYRETISSRTVKTDKPVTSNLHVLTTCRIDDSVTW